MNRRPERIFYCPLFTVEIPEKRIIQVFCIMNDQMRSAQPFRIYREISTGFPAIRMVLQIDFDTLEILDKAHDGFIGKGRGG